MSRRKPAATMGFSDVPAGCLATVITCLEMQRKPEIRQSKYPDGVALETFRSITLTDYRELFRRVGEEWLWYSRIVMDDTSLSSILNDSAVEIYVLRESNKDIGILELDFRVPGECELAFFGLISQVTGMGLGKVMMDSAIALAWSKPIQRFWVHTCTFDHPAALKFYISSGFKPYASQVEVTPDPRLSGHLPKTSAPHVPLISDD